MIFYLHSRTKQKKLMDYEIDLSDNFDFYLNKIIALTTNDKDDMDTLSTYKFLFGHFNNLRFDLNEGTYKIRHTIILDDQYTMELLQSKDWPYFIDRLLTVSEGEITFLNLSGVDNSSQNNFDEIKIINDRIDYSTICKDNYSNIYANIGATFYQYLQEISAFLIEKMEEDLTLNLYSFIDLKGKYNTEEVIDTSDRFFFTFGRFPTINNLAITPTGEVPSFVKYSNINSPSVLYKKFSSGCTKGLVCMQFLPALNIHLG